jgi:type I restriction enzyme S subunit
VSDEGILLADVATPRVEKAMPADFPNEPYLGLDDIEAHTTRLLGAKSSASMKSAAKRFYPGDVLYSRLRPYLNKVWVADRSGLCSAEFIVIPSNPNVDGAFLKYRLNAMDFVSFANSLNAGDRPRVDFDQIGAFHLPPFSLRYQKRIVAKIEELFSELEAGEASLRKARRQLGIYRQSLLKQAFEGKLTQTWRTQNPDKLESAATLLARIQSARTNERNLAKSKAAKNIPRLTTEDIAKLPILPKQWLWVRLNDLLSGGVTNGLYKPASSYGSGMWIVRIDDFYDGRLIRKNGFKRVVVDEREAEAYAASASDLLVNRVNSMEYLGKCCLVPKLAERLVFESNIMRMRTADDDVFAPFVVHYLASFGGRGRMCWNAKQAVNQASINQIDVTSTAVPLCSLPEQQEIVRLLDEQFEAIERNERELDAALKRSEALRQSILKRAFSGRLVPQDPADEPASQLLARLRAERATAPATKRKSARS